MTRYNPLSRAALALSRRQLLASAGVAAMAALPFPAGAEGRAAARYTLTARPGKASLRGPHLPETEIWGFEGTAPGPILRVRQGQRLDVQLVNKLAQPTTI